MREIVSGMDITSGWRDRTAQQLVRYEALFKLLDDIQLTDDIESIARGVARQWKYFANVACWRLVLPDEESFLVVDGFRGEARVESVAALSDWDARHWLAQVPRRIRPEAIEEGPPPPQHLIGKFVAEIQVLPFMRMAKCVGLLAAAARHEPFNELDIRFIRLFGGYLADRLSSILLRRQALAALLHKANRDTLTGLLNRGAIIERLEQHLALARTRCEPLGVILADIDFFKVINDNHGHLAGDEVLRQVSRRLQAHTFTGDHLGRYGGEEFLFVLHPCNAGEVVNAAERFRRLVADEPIAIGGDPPRNLRVTLSLGTATTDGDGEPRLEELLKRADDALYHAKAGGRNRARAG